MTDVANSSPAGHSRRDFLKQSATAVAAGTLVAAGSLRAGAFAGGSDVLKVGLVGCGGRGSGAAKQALKADPGTRLVAMGEVFSDRLEMSLEGLRNSEVRDRVQVDDAHKFVGFGAYQDVIDACDVIILAEAPHFRPAHLRAAIEAGKHVFAEKPVAVDAPGIRSVLATCKQAEQKGLSVVSGLCWRYDDGVRATFDQVHNGAIGEIRAMQCTYNAQTPWEPRRTREQCQNDMEYQLRNWYFYTWLSGDFNTEQHVHSLDKMAWAMKDKTPISVSGTGGRQQRTDPKYGNIYDHFSVVYEYANGVKAFATCRHFRGCTNGVTDHLFGSKGTCHINGERTSIEGEVKWRYPGEPSDMYQNEHNALFASIRAGKPINNGHYMSMSSMLAIAGRMSTYTGKTLTWEQCMDSQEDLTPPKYEWGPLNTPQVAIPGITPFV